MEKFSVYCTQDHQSLYTLYYMKCQNCFFSRHTHTFSTHVSTHLVYSVHRNLSSARREFARREVRKPNSCNIPPVCVLLACVCDNCSISTLMPSWPFLLLDELMPTRFYAQGSCHLLQTQWTVAVAHSLALPGCRVTV